MTEDNQLQFRNQWGPLVKIEMGREMPPGNACSAIGGAPEVAIDITAKRDSKVARAVVACRTCRVIPKAKGRQRYWM